MIRPLACLAAAALMLSFAGCTEAPDQPIPGMGGNAAAGQTSGPVEKKPLGEAVTNEGVAKVATYEVSVPDMDCPYGCYPTVAKTLSEMPSVAGVRLADPDDAQDGKIEDKRVFLDVGEGFDLDAAMAKLKEASFPATAEKVEASDG